MSLTQTAGKRAYAHFCCVHSVNLQECRGSVIALFENISKKLIRIFFKKCSFSTVL